MKRPVTMVTWQYVPERLSLPEAAAPSGLDPALLESLIYDARVDARAVNGQSLISQGEPAGIPGDRTGSGPGAMGLRRGGPGVLSRQNRMRLDAPPPVGHFYSYG